LPNQFDFFFFFLVARFFLLDFRAVGDFDAPPNILSQPSVNFSVEPV